MHSARLGQDEQGNAQLKVIVAAFIVEPNGLSEHVNGGVQIAALEIGSALLKILARNALSLEPSQAFHFRSRRSEARGASAGRCCPRLRAPLFGGRTLGGRTLGAQLFVEK